MTHRGEPPKSTGLHSDDSLLKALEKCRGDLLDSQSQGKLLGEVFNGTSEALALTDADGLVYLCNQAFAVLTGCTQEEMLGKRPEEVNAHPEAEAGFRQIRRIMEQEGSWQGEMEFVSPRGLHLDLWLTVTCLYLQPGCQPHHLWSCRDLAAIRESEQKISYLAFHDALTGLPNRILFHDRLKMALANAQRKSHSAAVLFLDLDNFKRINDGLGHAVGDELLQRLGKRLVDTVRGCDTVARLGGDEFIILLESTEQADHAALVAQRILDSLQRPFLMGGHEIHVTASLGVTVFPDDGDDPDTLISNADMAMYRAKGQGRNTYEMFTPGMNAKVVKRMALENAMRKALEQREFLVHYQPKVELASGEVVGVEALVRWHRPEHGLVSPGDFIPVAEETGQILEIGRWVLGEACRQARKWHDQGFKKLHMSVNLSPRQFQQDDLVEMVESSLGDSGLDSQFLELEVTESMVMNDVDEAIGILARLSDLGVELSMDDFGVGYSNLYYLKRFPMNTLKIDRSFVQDITTEPDDASIVDTIINMSRSLKMKVIAEGVETRDQLAFLRQLHCDQIQGFLFSRPLPKQELTNLLASGIHLN